MKRRGQKGHAMLELALSAGLMAACLGGTIQFGHAFYVYNQLVTAVGNGARFAAKRPLSTDLEADRSAIRNMVVYGESKPAPGAPSAVPGFTPDHVEVEFSGDVVRIAIRGYKIDALVTSISFDGRPAVEFPYIGPSQ